jgi:hypothetical protein
MLVNKINEETGNLICMCGEDCLPNEEGKPSANGMVMGSKGLVILHKVCIEAHNEAVLRGQV